MGSTMIDRDARDRLADIVLRMLRGSITVHQFEDELRNGNFRNNGDRGVAAFFQTFNGMSDEISILHDHILAGRHSIEEIQRVARVRRFLLTDLEYEWPPTLVPARAAVLLLKVWASAGMIAIPMFGTRVAPGLLSFRASWSFYLVVGVVNVFACAFISKQLKRRAAAAQEHRQVVEGRDPAIWPFFRYDDIPSEMVAKISPIGGPVACSRPLK